MLEVCSTPAYRSSLSKLALSAHLRRFEVKTFPTACSTNTAPPGSLSCSVQRRRAYWIGVVSLAALS
jgi:hypothetical protein